MNKYGKISEAQETAAEYRVNLFFADTIFVQLGNGGVPSDLRALLEKNKGLVEDVFSNSDSLYILPRNKEFATALYNTSVGPFNEDDQEYQEPCADEISWVKIEGRYWLCLWWD